jgi:hypothetical protein
VLRAFLEYNAAFEIRLWNDMLRTMGQLEGDGGSIWLQKVSDEASSKEKVRTKA